MKFLLCCMLLCSLTAVAEERISVCYNYACLNTATVSYNKRQLAEVRDLLDDAVNAAQERALLALVIGRLLGWAGQQSPIAADRGGNFADDGVNGKMDCIDHSLTTTRLLKMLAKRGQLHWHRVLEPELRTRFLIFDHWTAVIEEEPNAPYRDAYPFSRVRYAVDSWFNDNGKPAVVMPLDHWINWEGPHADDQE